MNIVNRKEQTMKKIWIMVLLMLLPVFASAQSAEQIIDRMEANQTFNTAIFEGEMVISDRFGDRKSTFKVYAQGSDYTLIEFTSREETGQKVLRTKNELYLYYPDAAEIIRMQGAALRESMLGSDVSYEDMTGGKKLRDAYGLTLLGEETVQGRECFKIEMTAKVRDVAYPRQIVWVDKELYVLRQSHQFALSGRLIKETEILEVARTAGKVFPVHYRITDRMRRSSGTEFRMTSTRINVSLPRNIFSLESLSW
jgi:outer membrane lipoprotein-sorting protein